MPEMVAETIAVVDSAGREVVVPRRVSRVATVGAVPQMNTYLLTLGAADAIVNGLSFARAPRFRFHRRFAPGLVDKPDITGSHGLNLEVIARLRPQIAVVKLVSLAEKIESEAGIPTLVLPARTPEGIKHAVRLLGALLDRSERAERYARYFDATVARVDAVTAAIPEGRRPTALYLHLAPLERRGFIMEWAIPQAGGRSVLAGSTTVPHPFSIPELLAWDPEVLVCMVADDRLQLLGEPEFAGLRAVRSGRVHVAPVGGHSWGNGCTEQPLGLLWLARLLHPGLFADLDLPAEAEAFYRDFYGTRLERGQIEQLLAAGG